MALHHELPIYKAGTDLLSLAVKAQAQMPRSVKRVMGEKIAGHCIEMLDRMAMANATQRDERRWHIEQLLKHQRTATVLLRVSHQNRHISHALWAESVRLLDSIGRQGGGWLKSAHDNRTRGKAPAA